MDSVPASYVLRVVLSLSTTLKPSFVKNVCQNG